jgi:hypothetical protein
MSVDDLAAALKAIDDDEVRRQVADGDVSAAGDLELTTQERSLLQAAADDYPDVTGFGFEALLAAKIGPDHIAHKHIAGVKYEDMSVSSGVTSAFDYLAQKGFRAG